GKDKAPERRTSGKLGELIIRTTRILGKRKAI
nr:hypothetical protein [Tanacetum cinerariifolium]